MAAKEWAAQIAEDQPFEALQVMQPFEVDDLAVGYVAENLSSEMSNRVAECAYEFGIERDTVLPVLRVVLRDALLARVGA